MRELAGKTAFVTGGASGIGFALGRAFAQAGMKVMLADIEADALAAAVENLRDLGPGVRGVSCDVADPASIERAAAASYEAFGNVHVVCNNAGVAGGSGIDNIALDNWRWVLDVNLMGVLHGIHTFLPHIRAHGEGGHIVNTASMAGLQSGLGLSPYATSKHAVVAMSEGWRSNSSRSASATVLVPDLSAPASARAGKSAAALRFRDSRPCKPGGGGPRIRRARNRARSGEVAAGGRAIAGMIHVHAS
jgi:NADP-dependent 3-hydroxy acid dehydrogenase YdfG